MGIHPRAYANGRWGNPAKTQHGALLEQSIVFMMIVRRINRLGILGRYVEYWFTDRQSRWTGGGISRQKDWYGYGSHFPCANLLVNHTHTHTHMHTQTDTTETLHRRLMYINKSTLILCKVYIICDPHTARRAVPRQFATIPQSEYMRGSSTPRSAVSL